MVRFVALIACLVASVAAFRPGDEVCVFSKTNKCPVNQLTLSKTDGSTLIYPGGKTRCAFDDYTSRRITTNATYFFQVFPKNITNKLLIYFQPGGACNTDQTCNFASQCSLPRRTFQVNAVAKSTGVLDSSNPHNVFRDWNVIHVPYCTGDIHVGKAVAQPRDYKFLLLRDVCKNQNMSTHLNGYENSMSALNWARANYPQPNQIVVAGSSAGALGAQLLAHTIAVMWNITETSKTKLAIIADSYVGVFPHGKTTGGLIKYFNACDVLPASIIDKCQDGTATSVELMQHILKATLFSDWLHVTSLADWVQRFFTKLLDVGFDRSLFLNHLNPFTFFTEMNTIITGEMEVSSRVSAFFVEGHNHIFLLHDDWYDTRRAGARERLGPFLTKWLENGTFHGEETPSTALPQPPEQDSSNVTTKE